MNVKGNHKTHTVNLKVLAEKKGKRWTVHFCAKAAPLSPQSQGDREGIGEGGGEGETEKEAQEVET